VSAAEPAAHSRSIAIVGAGIIGLSAAWRLAQAGWQVTVFDQGAIGGEASWAGAGMLAPGGEIDGHSQLATLALESCGLYPAFIRELQTVSGVEIDYQQCGALELAYSEAELDALTDKAARQADLGIVSKAIALTRIRQFWPRVRVEGLAGARFYPGDSLVNPRQVVHALRMICESAGVSLYPNCPVTKIDVSPGAVLIERLNASERFEALVLAAGAWSNSIALQGVPATPAVGPVKGHLIGYQQPDQTCSTILRYGHTYVLQRANGLLIVGASVERAGFDRSVKAEVIEDLARQAALVLPHLAETTPSEAWIGFRPASEDPRIGVWHSPRFYLAYGHYRNGILLAPVTAQRLVVEINANFGMR
jgi:glycine oxidase